MGLKQPYLIKIANLFTKGYFVKTVRFFVRAVNVPCCLQETVEYGCLLFILVVF